MTNDKIDVRKEELRNRLIKMGKQLSHIESKTGMRIEDIEPTLYKSILDMLILIGCEKEARAEFKKEYKEIPGEAPTLVYRPR